MREAAEAEIMTVDGGGEERGIGLPEEGNLEEESAI